MKLSKNTINILKNFSVINNGILFEPGSLIRTKTVQNTILAEATIEEVIPLEFGIYDLSEFLNVLSLFQNPDIEFSPKFMKIIDGKNSVKYYAGDKSILVTPKKNIVFPEPEISFELSSDLLQQIKKTSSILNAPDVSFVGDAGELKLVVSDKKNPTSNAFEYNIGNTELNFVIDFKVDMLKFINMDYNIFISSKKISKFESLDQQLVYYVGVEATSIFPEWW